MGAAGTSSAGGTWAGGYSGYTFARPATLIDGGQYELALTVANVSIPTPVQLRATVSGSGQEKIATYFGAGTQRLTFTVGDPGDAPVLAPMAAVTQGALGRPLACCPSMRQH